MAGLLFAFVGTTAACVLLGCTAPFAHTGAPVVRVLGAVLFVVGCIAVTAAISIPMNNTLAAVDPVTPGAASYWVTYLHRWTLWDDVRTGASVLACIVLTVAATR